MGTVEDIRSWVEKGRTDILRHVSIRFADGTWRNGRDVAVYDMPNVSRIHFWVGEDGRALRHCPFLHWADDGKIYCRIHDVKPKICIGFTPWNDTIRDYALNCPACREKAP
jgi:Fe-S-cluster containining protein